MVVGNPARVLREVPEEELLPWRLGRCFASVSAYDPDWPAPAAIWTKYQPFDGALNETRFAADELAVARRSGLPGTPSSVSIVRVPGRQRLSVVGPAGLASSCSERVVPALRNTR